jgi:hypothetical protein
MAYVGWWRYAARSCAWRMDGSPPGSIAVYWPVCGMCSTTVARKPLYCAVLRVQPVLTAMQSSKTSPSPQHAYVFRTHLVLRSPTSSTSAPTPTICSSWARPITLAARRLAESGGRSTCSSSSSGCGSGSNRGTDWHPRRSQFSPKHAEEHGRTSKALETRMDARPRSASRAQIKS